MKPAFCGGRPGSDPYFSGLASTGGWAGQDAATSRASSQAASFRADRAAQPASKYAAMIAALRIMNQPYVSDLAIRFRRSMSLIVSSSTPMRTMAVFVKPDRVESSCMYRVSSTTGSSKSTGKMTEKTLV